MLQQCLPFTVLKPEQAAKVIHHNYMELQQCLPFTVLKPEGTILIRSDQVQLQQCLPFTVLKLKILLGLKIRFLVATVLTVYGIETSIKNNTCYNYNCCNSVATVLTVYGIETLQLLPHL